MGKPPGLPWSYKVDGRLTRPGRAKRFSRGVEQAVIGDTEYADDTALFGFLDELKVAEKLFVQTLLDWDQKEHPDKREKLVVAVGGMQRMEVFNHFETRALKHLGSMLTDNADQWRETNRVVQAGFYAVKRLAKIWSLGTPRGRGSSGGLTTVRKLKVMRTVLEGTLLACGKTRVWNQAHERKANQVLARGIRRCLGLDVFNMSENNYSDASLRNMVCWDSFSTLIHRQVLKWVGHVARMQTCRAPKMALFGWPSSLESHRSARYTFPQWVAWLLQKYGIPEMDWFRLAQKPTGNWLQILDQALPRSKPSRQYQSSLNSWKVGDAILSPPRYAVSSRKPATGNRNPLKCPVCDFTATTARGLQVHYDGQHAVGDASLLTVGHSRCPLCSQLFVFGRDARKHRCPAKVHTLEALEKIHSEKPALCQPDFDMENLSGWSLHVDGSGPHDDVINAGGGVAIWTQDSDSLVPECELFGPVPLKSWDKRWLGAERSTNNVGELTAMGEAFLWLLDEAPGDPRIPACVFYDSEYAHHAITSSDKPEANEKLILNIRDLFSKVKVNRVLEFRHVKAHTGIRGNEFADHLAGQGAKGLQTASSKRWLERCDAPAAVPSILTDRCWRCGQVFTGPSHARALAGHEAHCKVPGAPPPFICCRHGCGKQFKWQFSTGKRKQPHHAREFRNTHERICRGEDELTRTCPFCDKVYVQGTTDETILKHRKECVLRPKDAAEEGPSWQCNICKSRFTTGDKATHEANCRGSAALNKTCSLCSETFQTIGLRVAHESSCRGSKRANLQCLFCAQLFTTFGSRITHEKACPSRSWFRFWLGTMVPLVGRPSAVRCGYGESPSLGFGPACRETIGCLSPTPFRLFCSCRPSLVRCWGWEGVSLGVGLVIFRPATVVLFLRTKQSSIH